MFETAFPGTQTFLPLFTNAAAQPLSRFHQHSAIYNEAGRARIQSTFSGVCLVFIWCLLLFGNTLSRSDLSTENGLNTSVIITCSQRQKHIKPFGRHSKTACRGFKSFCPCQTDSLKNGLFKPFLRLFFLFRAVLMLGEWVKNPRFGVYLVFMGIGLYRELLRFAAGFWLIHLVPSACFFDFATVDF